MATTPSSQHLRAWRACLTAHAKIVAQLEKELNAECRLALDWYEVLLLLHESEGGLRMHELADAQLLSRSAATRLIDRMEAAGLVVRRASEEDRRGTLVELTPDGLVTLRQSAPTHLRGIEEHFARFLSLEDARVIEDTMSRIAIAHGASLGML